MFHVEFEVVSLDADWRRQGGTAAGLTEHQTTAQKND